MMCEKQKKNMWLTVNNNYWMTHKVITHLFSLVSLMKIFGKSHQLGPKNNYSWQAKYYLFLPFVFELWVGIFHFRYLFSSSSPEEPLSYMGQVTKCSCHLIAKSGNKTTKPWSRQLEKWPLKLAQTAIICITTMKLQLSFRKHITWYFTFYLLELLINW